MGAIDTSYTFTATDVITSAKMNNILDQSTITSSAIIGDTLSVTSGKLSVRSGGITSNELAVNSVTTTAITDLNVTTAKIADLNVTTGKIADGAVTFGKIAYTAIAANADSRSETASKLITAPQVIQSPASAKSYGSFTILSATSIGSNRNLVKGYNIASAKKTSATTTDVTFTTGKTMSGSDYVVLCQTTNTGAGASIDANPIVYGKTATGFTILHSSDTVADRAIDFVVFGTLA